MRYEPNELSDLAQEMVSWSPQQVIQWALDSFDRLAISFSGAEDVVLIDMAAELRENVQVFTLDTGRLHPETYRFLEEVRERYPIDLEVLTPESSAVEALVRRKGMFSFYQDGHRECCAIRKVAPLRRKLGELDGWMTGLRHDQSEDTRAALPRLHHDNLFAASEGSLVKINPLAVWSSRDVWQYIRERDVPFNELHQKGFVSIGCEPCTRPVLPGQHEREGRWWWESAVEKECGLHAVTAKPVGKAVGM